jgi:hypothetical protein
MAFRRRRFGICLDGQGHLPGEAEAFYWKGVVFAGGAVALSWRGHGIWPEEPLSLPGVGVVLPGEAFAFVWGAVDLTWRRCCICLGGRGFYLEALLHLLGGVVAFTWRDCCIVWRGRGICLERSLYFLGGAAAFAWIGRDIWLEGPWHLPRGAKSGESVFGPRLKPRISRL